MDNTKSGDPGGKSQHEPKTETLIALFNKQPELKQLMIKSIESAKVVNPDIFSNPVQTLKDFYNLLDWASKCMPWNVIQRGGNCYASLFDQIDSAMNYFYFLFDQPLEELKSLGLYYNSLQYVPAIVDWMRDFVRNWGKYLSTPDSWNDEYYKNCLWETRFGLYKGWYEPHTNWHSFNDFFARKLKSPNMRPIAEPYDDSVVVAPADSCPRGTWKIDNDSMIISTDGVPIKSTKYSSIKNLLGNSSNYLDVFAGGTLTHTYLNEGDYHRYHFPVSGYIKEARIIEYGATGGGIQRWDKEQQLYLLDDKEPGWQILETRGLVILETERYGLVAVMPLGMAKATYPMVTRIIKA